MKGMKATTAPAQKTEAVITAAVPKDRIIQAITTLVIMAAGITVADQATPEETRTMPIFLL